MQSQVLCLRTCLRWKPHMSNQYPFIPVGRATVLVLWLHHDDHCQGWDLSPATWDSFCFSHPPYVSHVSKPLRDHCVFSPVLMFIFSSPVPAPRVSHGGWRMGENVCVCVFPSHRNTLNCSVFSVCEHRRIRSQLTAHRPTKTLCFCLFLTANHSYTLNNFWLCLCSQSVPFSSHSAICCALVLEWSNNYCDNRGPLPLSTLFSLTPPTPKDFLTA